MQPRAENTTWEPQGAAPSLAHRRAGQIWDERIGEARVQAHNWRRIAFVMGLIALLSIGGLIAQSFKQSVIPYLVEVESEGKVRLVGAVTEQEWNLSESAKLKALHDWIGSFRGLSSDPQIVKERLTYTRLHATAAANLQLERYLEEKDPLAKFGKEQRTVHIESTTMIAGSEQAYRVEWTEHVFGEEGQDLGRERFVGEFHLSITPPKTDEELRLNPLGIYITFFDFDQKR